MRPDDPMRQRSGARWCPEHGKWECTRRTKQGGICHEDAIRGRDVGRMHAGESGQLARAKGEALISAWGAELESTPKVDASWAVLSQLHVAVIRAGYYGRLLEEQATAAGEGAEVVVSPTGGLIGHTMTWPQHLSAPFATSEAVRALVVLEAQERDRVVRFAKTAHDMGIADMQIKLAERQGQMVAGVLGAVVAALFAELETAGAAETVRAAWPGWVSEIVPRELRALGEVAG